MPPQPQCRSNEAAAAPEAPRRLRAGEAPPSSAWRPRRGGETTSPQPRGTFPRPYTSDVDFCQWQCRYQLNGDDEEIFMVARSHQVFCGLEFFKLVPRVIPITITFN